MRASPLAPYLPPCCSTPSQANPPPPYAHLDRVALLAPQPPRLALKQPAGRVLRGPPSGVGEVPAGPQPPTPLARRVGDTPPLPSLSGAAGSPGTLP